MSRQGDDPAWTAYSRQFRERILPHLLASGCVLSIASGDTLETLDIRAATELGVAILVGKPLIIVVPTGRQISETLRRVAAVLVEDFDLDDPAGQERIMRALKQVDAEWVR